jgi:hypothetical protein
MHSPNPWPDPERVEDGRERRLARTLFWIGLGVVAVTALGATVAYVSLRIASEQRSDDPTTQRIQQLIDEANSLLKALDDQRNSA